MVEFLKVFKAPQASPENTKDAIEVLVKNMARYHKQRSHEVVHASDVTKETFCARRFRLLDVTNKAPKDEFIPAALRHTFDMGKDVARRVTDEWSGDAAVGHWKCLSCDKVEFFKGKPGQGCPGMGKCNWTYKEVEFFHPEAEISGSIDLMLRLGGPKVTLIELKIIKPDDFEKIVAPLGEHRARTQLYLRLVAESKSPYKPYINTDFAKVLYVSRGHGKKNVDVGTIVPFKEYTVHREDALVQVYIDRGLDVAQARHHKTIPIHKVCDSVACSTAKGCSVRQECFSGQYE